MPAAFHLLGHHDQLVRSGVSQKNLADRTQIVVKMTDYA